MQHNLRTEKIMFNLLRLLIYAVVVAVSAVSEWIGAQRMRLRVRRALGRSVNSSDLTSINTWIAVEEAEKRKPLG